MCDTADGVAVVNHDYQESTTIEAVLETVDVIADCSSKENASGDGAISEFIKVEDESVHKHYGNSGDEPVRVHNVGTPASDNNVGTPASDNNAGTPASVDNLVGTPASVDNKVGTPASDNNVGTPAKEGGEDPLKDDEKKGRATVSDDLLLMMQQEMGFNIKIVAPGVEPFEIMVTPSELIQEIYQVLMDKEETCTRTCFSLQLDGVTLDNFAEVKSHDKMKEGAEVHVVEDVYTGREARIHVRHVRDLLKSVDNDDSYAGVDGCSLSFINILTNGNITDLKKGSPVSSVDCTPPDYIMPNRRDVPLLPLHPISKDTGGPRCLYILTPSGWNPPPPYRRMNGDLMYIRALTLEDRDIHITASPRGFYINRCTVTCFDPRAVSPRQVFHTLVELLSHASPSFKRNFHQLLKRRAMKHPYERVPTAYQVHSWLAPQPTHTHDAIRAEDAFSTRIGYEEHIPGQTRDWNDEIQATKELPKAAVQERLLRERAVYKVYSDFVAAATRGAIAVVDGNIMAINPGEETKMQMYLWNNIFFSLGFDVKDHYKDFGGDTAAHYAPGLDLQGVKAYACLDIDGLYTLGTVIIDYRGYRVTAQSIIPGILEREQEQSVVYGSIDFGKTVSIDDRYTTVLKKTCHLLRIQPHKVLSGKEGEEPSEVQLYTSVECKGIVGNDRRLYLLDLLRTAPPDPNYLPVSIDDTPTSLKELGFPRPQRHVMVVLRAELLEHFAEHKYIEFLYCSGAKFKEHFRNDTPQGHTEITKEDNMDIDEVRKLVKSHTDVASGIVREACISCGSVLEDEFHIAFNPDLYQPLIRHISSEDVKVAGEKKLLMQAAEFLVIKQIPHFVQQCVENSVSPTDCYEFIDQLHVFGINVRYLGYVADKLASISSVDYVYIMCVSEIIVRSFKHIFCQVLSNVGLSHLSAAVAHLLNCLLGSVPDPSASLSSEDLNRGKKRGKKNKSRKPIHSTDTTDWATESPRSLWKKLVEESKTCYSFNMHCEGIDTAIETYRLSKVVLLRMVCKRLGIQLLLKEYPLDSKTKQSFQPDDIVNMFPVVKSYCPKASDAYAVFSAGQTKIQQGLLQRGHELVNEAMTLLTSVYGAMHPEIAACNRLLARLSYIMGDYSEALVLQHRAVIMSERVQGIDHPDTMREYANLALYCFANQQVVAALKLMYRVRYLSLLCHGEDHPDIALCDSNIGLILHAVGEGDLSAKFLQKALDLNIKFFGAKSLRTGQSYHLLARIYACNGDYRSALKSEREAYGVFKDLFGDGHDKTRESSDFLKLLTEEAVKLQKTVNALSKGVKPPPYSGLQIQLPTPNQVLDMLNSINGIVFVHISAADIERFRDQLLRIHRAEMMDNEDEKAELTAGSAELTEGEAETKEIEKKMEQIDID